MTEMIRLTDTSTGTEIALNVMQVESVTVVAVTDGAPATVVGMVSGRQFPVTGDYGTVAQTVASAWAKITTP